MEIYRTRNAIKESLRGLRSEGNRIGFVPTMGALHEGHLSLARTLRHHCDVRVCSIFVNPRQFNDPRDYEAYQINIEKDAELLRQEELDILFAPLPEEVYPSCFQTKVQISNLTRPFEGARRPGHFDGVTTVVATLFGIIRPDCAIFGEKDFQQLRVVEQMVEDLGLDIEILRGALVRDSDGLALSSRNIRLSPKGRQDALGIIAALREVHGLAKVGERSARKLFDKGMDLLDSIPGAEVEYLAIVDEATLAEVESVDSTSRVLVVVQIEGVRLLDNISLRVDGV